MSEVDFLRTVSLFMDLDDMDLVNIARLFKLQNYTRNQYVFFESAPGDQFYIVKSGSVRVFRIAEDGRETVLDIITEGNFFGEMAVLDGDNRSANAQAREQAQLLVMNGADFNDLVTKQPSIALTIISTLSRRLRQANACLEDLAFRNARTRVIRAINRLASISGTQFHGGVKISLRITHHELGAMSGTSRETVTRTLQYLQENNVVRVESNHLVIPDLKKLDNYY